MGVVASVADVVVDTPLMFTFDVNNTIADIDGVSHLALISRASPEGADVVRRVLYEEIGLKTLPSRTALTRDLRQHACERLRIAPEQFPYGEIPVAPYRLRDDAPAAVAAAAGRLPTALITNTSVFADPALKPVADGLAPHLSGIHASWAMGAAKPDPRAFQAAARFHGVEPANFIHITTSWRQDVVPVLALGGRAVWINPHDAVIPGSEPVPSGRLLVARTLRQAVDQAIARWLSDTVA